MDKRYHNCSTAAFTKIVCLLAFAWLASTSRVQAQCPTASFTVTNPAFGQGEVTLTANAGTGYSYQWQFNTVNIPGATAITYKAGRTGNYIVIVRSNGCSTTSAAVSVTVNENHYVITNTLQVAGITTPAQISSLTGNDLLQSITYLDNLSRPVQEIVTQGSSSRQDVIRFRVYDNLNRQAKQYLHYPNQNTTNDNDGRYRTDVLTAQPTYFQGWKSDDKAFAESRFEDSPLSRVIEQGAPGTPWQLAATPAEGKTGKISYGTNAASEVRIWYYTMSTTETAGVSYYKAGALSVTQYTDEHGLKLREYKNKSGQVVCKKAQRVLNDESSYLFTYYVYDPFGNLRFIIPPEAVNQLASVNYVFTYNNAFCQKWLFAYQYDSRWRLTEKSVPGGGITYLVYDPLDRVVLTQDAARRPNNQWFFTKYDALGRTIMSGRYTHSAAATQVQMQEAVNAYYAADPTRKHYESRSATDFANLHGYTNQAFPVMPSPNSTAGQPYRVSYYDDYDFDHNGTPGETAKGEPAFVNMGTGFVTAPGRAKGAATGVRTLVLGTSTWLLSAQYYDTEGRVIQSQTENYNTTGIVPATKGRNLEVIATAYDFTGKATRTERRHCYAISDQTYNLATKQRYVYDHMGRVKEHYVQVNSEPEERIALYTYNPLGELTAKGLGHPIEKQDRYSTQMVPQQTIDYSYNIRGWLRSINATVPYRSHLSDDLFAMGFVYEGSAGTETNVPQYNGNISYQSWMSQSDYTARSYKFQYDGLNRLVSAENTHQTEKFSVNNLTYDANGNLKTLDRQGLISRVPNANDTYGYVDKLQYGYEGNRLTWVEDAITTGAAATHFKEQSYTATNPIEYTYDPAGKLTADKNKGITSIIYNDLDLPATITFSANDYLTHVYDAAGGKRQTTVTAGGSTASTVKYLGGIVYLNDVPQFIPTTEGRILSPQVTGETTWTYEYHYRDQLGNLRVAFRLPKNSSSTATLEPVADPAWSNVSSPVRNNERASAGSYSAKLTTANPLGPWKTVKVGKGDEITMRAMGLYTQDPTNNNAVNLVAYVNSLSAQSAESGNKPQLLSVGLSVTPTILNSVQATVPKAYLAYILQTADGTVIKSQRIYLTGTAKNAWQSLFLSYTAEADGYLQVLVANESDQAVWFDEVSLQVQPSMIVQETHYDPWGVELAGFERRNNPEHDYKFQDKELVDELGLYWMDFGARYYDPVLGRWHVPDPADQFGSPYVGMGNNPVLGVDPDGRWVHIAIGAAIGGVVNLGVKAFQGKIHNFRDGFVAFGIGAAAGAITAATGGAAAGAAGLSTSTIAGGALAGASGAVVGSPIQGVGNMIYFGDAYSAQQFGIDVVTGGVLGGVAGGVAGWLKNRELIRAGKDPFSLWNGKPIPAAMPKGAYGTLGDEGATAVFDDVVHEGKTYAGGKHEIPTATAPAKGGSKMFTLTASEGDLLFYSTKIGDDVVEFGGNFSKSDGVLTIKNFDIDGALTNKLGIRGIKDILTDFGKQQRVNQIIIQGAKRTTGANPGKIPSQLIFKID